MQWPGLRRTRFRAVLVGLLLATGGLPAEDPALISPRYRPQAGPLAYRIETLIETSYGVAEQAGRTVGESLTRTVRRVSEEERRILAEGDGPLRVVSDLAATTLYVDGLRQEEERRFPTLDGRIFPWGAPFEAAAGGGTDPEIELVFPPRDGLALGSEWAGSFEVDFGDTVRRMAVRHRATAIVDRHGLRCLQVDSRGDQRWKDKGRSVRARTRSVSLFDLAGGRLVALRAKVDLGARFAGSEEIQGEGTFQQAIDKKVLLLDGPGGKPVALGD